MHKAFEKSLKTIAKPALVEVGYQFDGKRRFTKTDHGANPLIIEYQVGVRAAQGTFTVNLIKGKALRRLNTINPTWFSRLIKWIFGAYD